MRVKRRFTSIGTASSKRLSMDLLPSKILYCIVKVLHVGAPTRIPYEIQLSVMANARDECAAPGRNLRLPRGF